MSESPKTMSHEYDDSGWTDSVVKEYLTATSQQVNEPEKFYKTHLRIDKIYAEFLGGSYQDQFVDQEAFRDEILNADIDSNIRTFILRGETGSGKSQLCQWLDYELQGLGDADDVDDRIPLHIKANETSLEQIISTLAEPLGIDPEVDQVTELDAGNLAEGIVTSLRANPGQKLRDVNIDAILDPDGGDLQSILEENIRSYQKGLEEGDETDFDPNLISKDDYRKIRLRLGTESLFHKNKDVLRQALRDEIHRHFSHLIGVDDFQGQLRDYTQRYVEEHGKRPVIICEDVTTFSVLKEQLLDQIIQVESANYDIVLGYTTGFEQDDLQDALGDRGGQDALTYLQDRAEGYLSLTDDGEAYFLDDSLSVELVRKYLNVIKTESGSDIDAAVESAFDDLYPFNEAFIRRAYANLQEDGSPRQTPRVLLQKVVRRSLLADEPPFVSVDKNTNVADVVPAITPAKYEPRVQQVVTWYGVQDDEEAPVRIHVDIAETFDVAEAADSIETIDGEQYALFEPNSAIADILVPSSSDSGFESGGSSGSDTDAGESSTGKEFTYDGDEDDDDEDGSADGDSGSSSGTSGTTTDGTNGVSRKKQQLSDFYDWVSTGDSYESSNVLRSGAEDILEMWYDPTRLANPNASTRGKRGIYYTRGQNVPVSIQGPDERNGLDVMLPFGEENLDIYTDILQTGIQDELPDDANVEQLRSWATNKVVDFRNDIRESVEDCLPPELDIEHCILLGQYLLMNAEYGETEFDTVTVFADSTPPEDREYDNPLVEAFGRRGSITEALGELQKRRSDFTGENNKENGLIQGFFLLKENVVDYDRLRPVQRDIAEDPEKYLSLAQQIDTEELDYPDGFRIGTSRSNASVHVTALLDAISDYAVELSMLTDADLKEHFNEELNAVQRWYDPSHTVADLIEVFEGDVDGSNGAESPPSGLLDCLGVFDQTQLEQWQDAYEDLTDDSKDVKLGEFGDVVDDFLEPDTDSPFERLQLLHQFEQSLAEHDAWDIYKALDEMIKALDDYEVEKSTDLEERIRDLRGLEEYETKRSDVISSLNTY